MTTAQAVQRGSDASGTLFIVATPIGHLKDITHRAVETLAESDLIVCEDTRVTSKLLAAYKISKPLWAVHQHSASKQIARVIAELACGKKVAYVSDAGTPGVNDPGGKLVAAVFDAGIPVEPIPGPSALTAAISVCGFPMDEFTYHGFAPHKKGRATFFRSIADDPRPSIFFESTHRIQKAINALEASLDPKRMFFIGREMTKMHETLYRGTIREVKQRLGETSLKGEFVIILGPI